MLTCLSGPVVAAPDDVAAEEAGIEIAREARARKSGFGNFTARQVMVLRNKRGQESRRQIRVRVLEVEGDGDKSMFVFDQPRDVEGTAFLIYSHKEDADEQWLYLPALKRVKRISSSNRSGSFMGSEFAYEDMSARTFSSIPHGGIPPAAAFPILVVDEYATYETRRDSFVGLDLT